MYKAKLYFIIGALLSASAPALAGTIRHDLLDGDYTSLAANEKYDAVGAVVYTQVVNGTAQGRIGSGALIASDWVLTAAHVVGGNDLLGSGITNMHFVLGPTVAGGTSISADKWLPIPGWNGNSNQGIDVGLVHLSSDLFGIEPARRYIGSGEKGLTGTHVGYGRSGTGTTGDTLAPGTKRAGTNVIDKFGGEIISFNGNNFTLSGNSNIMYADFDRPSVPSESSMGGSAPTEMEYQIAGGDSGGPLFIESNNQPLIAGVHTLLAWLDSTGNADYGDLAGSTRLNGFWQSARTINDWISSVVTVAGDADADFDVDMDDLAHLAHNYGITSGGHWHLGDFDLDGDVDISDLGSLATHYSAGQAQAFADFQVLAVPEPAAGVAIAGVAMALLLRRRRRA